MGIIFEIVVASYSRTRRFAANLTTGESITVHQHVYWTDTEFIVFHVYIVRERDLLVIAGGKKTDLLDHPCKSASSVRATRESKQGDPVTLLVCQTKDE